MLKQLVLAICFIESGGDPLALNHRDGKGHNNHSFGLCQVTYQTAIELGMNKQESCQQDLRPRHLRTPRKCQLFDADRNKEYASLYFQHQMTRYNNNVRKAISAYNAGSYSTKNKDYVKKVLKRFEHEKSIH